MKQLLVTLLWTLSGQALLHLFGASFDKYALWLSIVNSWQVVMNRARNVAQAAWTHQSLRVSSWSCMGPRHRSNAASASSKSEENDPNSHQSGDHPSTGETKHPDRAEVITSEHGMKWSSEVECSHLCASANCSKEIENNDDEGSSDGEDLMGNGKIEDSMTEVELWQQLEHELNQPRRNEETIDDEDDMVKEAREEEEEEIVAAAETADNVSVEPTAEMRRFFPPGKIMHIVPIPLEETANEENGEEGGDDNGSGARSPKLPKVQIFLTPRSLYGKLRLSRTMINDHYMPMYKRSIELAISELEKDNLSPEGCQL